MRAAEAKVPNVITFSGNRKGMGDQEGKENCILGLNRIKKFAEDNGVTVVPGTAEQQGEPQGLHVRPHGLGGGCGEGQWIRRA